LPRGSENAREPELGVQVGLRQLLKRAGVRDDGEDGDDRVAHGQFLHRASAALRRHPACAFAVIVRRTMEWRKCEELTRCCNLCNRGFNTLVRRTSATGQTAGSAFTARRVTR